MGTGKSVPEEVALLPPVIVDLVRSYVLPRRLTLEVVYSVTVYCDGVSGGPDLVRLTDPKRYKEIPPTITMTDSSIGATVIEERYSSNFVEVDWPIQRDPDQTAKVHLIVDRDWVKGPRFTIRFEPGQSKREVSSYDFGMWCPRSLDDLTAHVPCRYVELGRDVPRLSKD